MAEKKLEDWMRLILINWIVISMTVFYAVIAGTLTALATAWAARRVLAFANVSAQGLALFPAPGTALWAVIACWIAVLAVTAFRTIRYRCHDGSYFWQISRIWIKRAGQFWAGLALVMLAVGLAG